MGFSHAKGLFLGDGNVIYLLFPSLWGSEETMDFVLLQPLKKANKISTGNTGPLSVGTNFRLGVGLSVFVKR